MTHEELWSRIYQIGTAGLGWTPRVVMDADMSDILLAWEGRAWLNQPPTAASPAEPAGDALLRATLSDRIRRT